MKESEKKKNAGLVMVFINIILICLLASFFYVYSSYYQSNMREQNIVNIQNLNESSAEISL